MRKWQTKYQFNDTHRSPQLWTDGERVSIDYFEGAEVQRLEDPFVIPQEEYVERQITVAVINQYDPRYVWVVATIEGIVVYSIPHHKTSTENIQASMRNAYLHAVKRYQLQVEEEKKEKESTR